MIVLKGHKYAIEYGLFSSDGKYFVSVCNRDGSMFVWDLRNGDRITQNKNSKNINCIKFM
jgi:WD40 repeat protein